MTDQPTSPQPDRAAGEQENGRPTVRDKRRVDPATGQVRQPSGAQSAAADGQADEAQAAQAVDPAEVDKLRQQLDDRTSDLQRVQAEYVNYKRRVDRDRDLARAAGIESVMRELLPVLDSLRAAREHEELTGGFKGVADEIERIASRHGLVAYGEVGDPFDPQIHEALMHGPATDGITGPTCVTILQPGYKLKDRVLRPARVAVAEPADGSAAPATEAGGQAGGESGGQQSGDASEASEGAVGDGSTDSAGSSGSTGAGSQQ